MNESIFLVEREDYKAFIERLKSEVIEVKEEELTRSSAATKVFSKKTGKCLCSRVYSKDEDEKYYIFDFPDDDEWGPPIPKRKITLETKEQVQLLFDFIRRKNND